MDPFTAGLKYILRSANDKLLSHRTQKAKDIAYQKTGKDMRKANRKGYYINGSKTYREKLNREIEKEKVKHNNRDKFISDL